MMKRAQVLQPFHPSNPGSAFTHFMTSVKLLSLSVPQFSHLQNGHNNNTYLIGLLGGLSKFVFIEHLRQHLAIGEFAK